MQEHVVEVLAVWDRPVLEDLLVEVLPRGALRRRVLTRVVLGAEPRPVKARELADGNGLVGELVLDFRAPRLVPSLDGPFASGSRLSVLRTGTPSSAQIDDNDPAT
jgi:hypothetical protein